LSIDALGAVIGIDGSALSDEAWTAAQTAWQDAMADPPVGVAPDATVTAHGSVSAQATLAALSMEVTLAALEARAGDLLMLHAAGLATEEGGVVALVGPSGRGKTTASRVLGREFAYVSDESIGIAADGAVLSYRKPLSLIEHNPHLKAQRSPSELHLLPLPTAPLRLAALVLLERSDDATAPRMEPVSLAHGIAELAQQASYLGRLSSPLRTLAAHIEAVGGVRRIIYSNAETLAPIIHELGAKSPATPGLRASMETPAASPEAESGQDSSPRYRRIPVLDSFALDDHQGVLLVQDDEQSTRVVVLDGIAPTLWRNASQPISLAALVEAAVAVHGQPVGEDAASLVAASVADLTEAGLLVVD
jgi:hypothetical protein